MITGGKSFVTAPPAFSNDAKKLLICTGNSVSIFSTSTALQITELEGHTAAVTSVIVVPATTPAGKILCYCWTASLDGTIRYWDFSVPESIKTIDIRFPIHSMVIPGLLGKLSGGNKKPLDLFAYVSAEAANKQKKEPTVSDGQVKKKQRNALGGQILKCNLTESHLVAGATLAETPKPEFITISPSGEYIGIQEKRKLRIWEVPGKDSERASYKKIRLHHTKSFTALAFHPTERIIAAGDTTGRILIWRGFGNRTFSAGVVMDEDERPGVREDDDADSCTTWHWHSAEVKILFFSADGAYLYSGGKEGVLVVWQLDTGKKKFLPRIGSTVFYFTSSPDPSLSSISCGDNRVHLLQMPSMEIMKSISGIKLPGSVPELIKGPCSNLVFDYAAGLVAIPSESYCIQVFSLFDNREITEVQVCERNHQPGDEVTVVLNLVSLSLDGSLMSTVETRLSEEGIGGLVSLKFWARGPQSKDFSLSTIVYEPHRDAGVSGFAFHPTRRMAVSSSTGGEFKIWVSNYKIQQRDQKFQNTGWTCHAIGSYKKKPMTAVAFSFDGSVLAVAAAMVITLWDPEKNVLVAVIGESLEPIVSLSFIGKSEYLVSASRGSSPQLSVWNMSKLSASWSYKLHTEAVACTHDDSFFAILALLPKSTKLEDSSESILHDVDGSILLFNVGDPVPVATWFVRKAKGGGLAFIHNNPGLSANDTSDGKPAQVLLAYINGDHEYVLFHPHGEQASKHAVTHRESHTELEDSGRYGYASIYGELPEYKLMEDETPKAPLVPSGRPWETIFSGSSHNLPPLPKLCSVFLESLLERRTTVVE
ncbi:hypothetical protein RJ640_004997 [Escallonia rubra]|uniref:WD repeat-containing protein 75 second beta-propeller domain-containing protein n=1 Tax=Escallonia rubra TaxID=112253 RepID=A0AA88QLR4_9ASTE|nr:hypothetical protein RJ640_004997 [Escallonia rubra]